jgi:antirestriction protein ArdC
MKKAYEIIVEQILDKLDWNLLPWQQNWTGGSICNYLTNTEYRGMNKLVLAFDTYEDKRYLTMNQVRKLKWRIKKGSKSQKIIYWQFNNKDNEKLEYPIIKYYNVFNVNNVEWIDIDIPRIITESYKYEAVNNLINNYLGCPKIKNWPNPIYQINTDTVFIPNKDKFNSLDNYYSVLLHELIHSTWSKKRLNRFTDSNIKFWNEIYSKEELVAELGSMFLSMELWIINEAKNNNVAYLQSWTKYMKDNKKEIIYASQQAQLATDYMYWNPNYLKSCNKNIR